MQCVVHHNAKSSQDWQETRSAIFDGGALHDSQKKRERQLLHARRQAIRGDHAAPVLSRFTKASTALRAMTGGKRRQAYDADPDDEELPCFATPRGFYSPCVKALRPDLPPRLFRPEESADLSPRREAASPRVYETPVRQTRRAPIESPGGTGATIPPPFRWHGDAARVVAQRCLCGVP